MNDPIPMLLFCPRCDRQHVDAPDFPPHRSHECQGCKYIWRPADVETVGVRVIATEGGRDNTAHPFLAKTRGWTT